MSPVGRCLILVALSACACSAAEKGAGARPDAHPIEDVIHVGESQPALRVHMDFTRQGGFFSAPFPSEDLRLPDGRVDVSGIPNPEGDELVEALRATIAESARGFGRSSGIFFTSTLALDEELLPSVVESAESSSSVFVQVVDEERGSLGARIPSEIAFHEDGGPFGAPRMLSVLPLAGIPLPPRALVVAGVRRSLEDAEGNKLGVPLALSKLIRGRRPEGMGEDAFADYRSALEALEESGVNLSDLAGLALLLPPC